MRVEKLSTALFLPLARLSEISNGVILEAVILRTIEKLRGNGNVLSADAIETLAKNFRDGGLFVVEDVDGK